MQNSGELYAAFRSDLQDAVAPYLWTDEDVYRYMNTAYVSFVRNTGGVADSTSDITVIPLVVGTAMAVVSPLILRYRQAILESTNEEVAVINEGDAIFSGQDYGVVRTLMRGSTQGDVRYMVTGQDRTQAGGIVRWVQVPAVADNVLLSVYRLPLDTIAEGDEAFVFPDIGAEHIEHLLLGMKGEAYGKHDGDAFDATKRSYYKEGFANYCAAARREWERYKHKTRVVEYGGL